MNATNDGIIQISEKAFTKYGKTLEIFRVNEATFVSWIFYRDHLSITNINV